MCFENWTKVGKKMSKESREDQPSEIGMIAFLKQLEFNENKRIIKEEEPMRKENYKIIAHELKNYYDALILEGFNNEQAINLIGMQAVLWLNQPPQKDN